MPWCDDCDKYLTPTAMTADGGCPTCGRPVNSGEGDNDVAADERAPWHFKLLVGAVALYLGWRFVQMVGLLF